METAVGTAQETTIETSRENKHALNLSPYIGESNDELSANAHSKSGEGTTHSASPTLIAI